MTKVKKEGQGKLFQQSFLEYFTRTNPVIHVLTYGGVVLLYLYMNEMAVQSTLLFFVIGMVIWTLVEYVVHRFVFHLRPSKFQYMIHGVHHEYPRDKERLMMPPVPGITVISVFTLLFYIFLGTATPAFMAGFVTAYMLYTFVHYIVHAWKPIPGIKFLWAHHHKHHNPAFEHKAYGVSSPLWDVVFGTMPPRGNR